MAFTQANRPLRIQTPLGPDKLLPVEFQIREGISQLFEGQMMLLAEPTTKIEFDQLIGQKILVELDGPGGKTRYFHGICHRFAEGRRDAAFCRYRLEIVPQFWLLTRRHQSRIFQQISVPDILKQVLQGLDVKFDLQGEFYERDYCVQYRESDFNFACRLMEDEGIYYYFTHSAKGHTMVIANAPAGHVDVPIASKLTYDEVRGGNRAEMRITDWEKVQELRSGKVTLWDHCFELPQQHLEATRTIQDSVAVGQVTHKLKLAENDKLEMYDYPGSYAQRFDGIDPGGGDRTADLEKIFADNARVVKLRIEQEAAESLQIRGSSNCRQLTSGHKFTLERHHNADGAYVLTSITHVAKIAADYRSGEGETLSYENRFSCLPLALPYRPPLRTPKPTVNGAQTATVVGAPGEPIFCDKYGRIKVQFHWDRQGKKDAQSSCWVRVSQNWGGANWGGMFVPHVGQEVIVDFEEGDPDRPLVTGRVYNAEAMPPLELPANKTRSIIRDHGGNEIKMQGHDGEQSICMYSPHGDTKFKLGAPNWSWDGIFMETGHAMKQAVNGVVEFFFGNDWKVDLAGNFGNTIKGAAREIIHGWKFEMIGGIKTDVLIGAYTEFTLGHKTGMVLAGNSTYDPISDKEAKAEETRMIGKMDEKIATVRQDMATIDQKIGTLDTEVADVCEHIINAMNSHVGTLNQKIDGNMTQITASLDQKVKGVYNLVVNKWYLKSDADVLINAAGNLDIDVSGSINMNAPKLTLNGSSVSVKDGTLKVT